MKARIEFEPHDLWVGVYWRRYYIRGWDLWQYQVYICLLPMFPLHLQFEV